MIMIGFIYVVAFLILFPPLLKYKHKGAMTAFVIIFSVCLVYSVLRQLNVPMDNLPLFFSRLLRDWGIKYPPVYS